MCSRTVLKGSARMLFSTTYSFTRFSCSRKASSRRISSSASFSFGWRNGHAFPRPQTSLCAYQTCRGGRAERNHTPVSSQVPGDSNRKRRQTHELLVLGRAKGDVESRFGAAAAPVPGRLTAHEALELLVRRAHCGTRGVFEGPVC